MADSVLIIAFHFPPIQGSSGFLRTLKFARYLPEFGIAPTVLTVSPRVYGAVDERMLAQIPAGVEVKRCFALDTKRDLGFRGRYPGFLGLPDRYATWIPTGAFDGIRLIRRKRIGAVFSTYPIPSAHVIAGLVARATGKPWIADFRDPMWDPFIPFESGAEKRARMIIEKSAVARARKVTVVTDSMKSLFGARYPSLPADRIEVIANGFDEADFAALPPPGPRAAGPLVLLHAGLLEREDRDPAPFFRALCALKAKGRIDADRLRVRLIAPGDIEGFAREAAGLGLEGMVSVEKGMPYAEALRAMAASDILLLFQGPSCDTQIPAKVYEYLRVGKPILALATREGETGRLVEAARSGRVLPMLDSDAIAAGLEEWLDAADAGKALPTASAETVKAFSRRTQAGQLAGLIRGL